MKSAGIRELRNKLSDYVRRVRSGETIFITNRGEVVAELNPPGQGNVDRYFSPGLVELARRGLVTLPRNDRSAYRRPPGLMKGEEVAELLGEVRGYR
jgi:antitoxin (DNA-binding transcriptional repressor) of toxin-antitoxin stability system